MGKFEKICFAKIAWAEDYQGDEVYGRHAYIQENKDGHERFNFMPGPDGRYYASIPPYRMPDDPLGWLIIFMAAETANNGKSFGGLRPVGWFENADFVSEQYRPEYLEDPDYIKAMASRIEVRSKVLKKKKDVWRVDYSSYAEDLVARFRPTAPGGTSSPGVKASNGAFLAEAPSKIGFATSEHRMAVKSVSTLHEMS